MKKKILFIALFFSIIIFGNSFAEGDSVDKLRLDSDILWTCIAAFLVFFMQAGFAMVESCFTRAKNAANIMMKNIMDFSGGTLAFWLIGASLMFGANASGFIGAPDIGLSSWLGGDDPNRFSYLIFQTVFAATAATIVSGGMAERTKFHAYLIYSIVVTAFIYPTFGSWAWNSLWSTGTGGWLENLKIGESQGFMDFAGSTDRKSVV